MFNLFLKRGNKEKKQLKKNNIERNRIFYERFAQSPIFSETVRVAFEDIDISKYLEDRELRDEFLFKEVYAENYAYYDEQKNMGKLNIKYKIVSVVSREEIVGPEVQIDDYDDVSEYSEQSRRRRRRENEYERLKDMADRFYKKVDFYNSLEPSDLKKYLYDMDELDSLIKDIPYEHTQEYYDKYDQQEMIVGKILSAVPKFELIGYEPSLDEFHAQYSLQEMVGDKYKKELEEFEQLKEEWNNRRFKLKYIAERIDNSEIKNKIINDKYLYEGARRDQEYTALTLKLKELNVLLIKVNARKKVSCQELFDDNMKNSQKRTILEKEIEKVRERIRIIEKVYAQQDLLDYMQEIHIQKAVKEWEMKHQDDAKLLRKQAKRYEKEMRRIEYDLQAKEDSKIFKKEYEAEQREKRREERRQRRYEDMW